MNKLSFPRTTIFEQLPFSLFDEARYSVYIIDANWNFLFVNKFVSEYIGERASDLKGKNMWSVFPELENDIAFQVLRQQSDSGIETSIVTISPITAQRLYITGQKLKDCLLFTSSILPKKEDVIADIRSELDLRKIS